MTSPSENNAIPVLPLGRRMLAVMRGLPYIQKKKALELGGRQVKTISYEDLAADVQPLLVEHGILVMSSLHALKVETVESEKAGYRPGDPPKKVVTTIATVEMDFTFINADNAEDRLTVRFPGQGFDTSDKAVGKATTYAAKDCFRKVFVVPSGEEPEDDNHERPSRAPAKAAPREDVADIAGGPTDAPKPPGSAQTPQSATAPLNAIGAVQSLGELEKVWGGLVPIQGAFAPADWKALRKAASEKGAELKRKQGEAELEKALGPIGPASEVKLPGQKGYVPTVADLHQRVEANKAK